MDDFDKEFGKMQRRMFVVWIVWAACVLTFMSCLIFTAIHFLHKVW